VLVRSARHRHTPASLSRITRHCLASSLVFRAPPRPAMQLRPGMVDATVTLVKAAR
jgi:hypothetical protein